MPLSQRIVYNPNILGFNRQLGPLFISLGKARQDYGSLPSQYHLVPPKEGRVDKPVLNLLVGNLISERLNKNNISLKRYVYDFFSQWHRDLQSEFKIHMAPFFNLHDSSLAGSVISENIGIIRSVTGIDIRAYIMKKALIKKDTLNSISDRRLPETALKILLKKLKNHQLSDGKKNQINRTISRIKAFNRTQYFETLTGKPIDCLGHNHMSIYADEIWETLMDLSNHMDISGFEYESMTTEEICFKFAKRDRSWLLLGKDTGDCTADKANFQADHDVENIYWTVFPWILDRNYQILKVFYKGIFVMKVHLLPLLVLHDHGDKMMLAVDAIETVRALRDDVELGGQSDIVENKTSIMKAVMAKIVSIASHMGIDNIYAEKFSNTKWVRETLGALPEIYLNVANIIKIDELEDVFTLAEKFCTEMGQKPSDEIFMEVQMKNTSLVPGSSSRAGAIKSFAVIRGNSNDGIPMKKVVGI